MGVAVVVAVRVIADMLVEPTVIMNGYHVFVGRNSQESPGQRVVYRRGNEAAQNTGIVHRHYTHVMVVRYYIVIITLSLADNMINGHVVNVVAIIYEYHSCCQ